MSADGESADCQARMYDGYCGLRGLGGCRRLRCDLQTRRIRGRVGGRQTAYGRVGRQACGRSDVRRGLVRLRRADVRRGLVRLRRALWVRLSVLRTGLPAGLSARRRAIRQGEIFLQKAGSARERNVAVMGFSKRKIPPPIERTAARRRAKTGSGSGVKKQSPLPRRAQKKRRIAADFRRLFECTFLQICLSGTRPKARNPYTNSEHLRHRTRRAARLPALRDRRMAHRCPARPLRRVQRLLSRLFALLFCTFLRRG